jgi:hypothetical protein
MSCDMNLESLTVDLAEYAPSEQFQSTHFQAYTMLRRREIVIVATISVLIRCASQVNSTASLVERSLCVARPKQGPLGIFFLAFSY